MAIGVIGGSGIYKLDELKHLSSQKIETPYGEPSDEVIEFQINGADFFFIPRHGKGHRYTPTEVNYRANIYALKKLGCTHIISLSAVGSLKEELPPTTVFLPDQFMDWTKGQRERSFFGEGVVGHVSAAYAVDKKLQQRIYEVAQENSIEVKKDGTHICIEGPHFSTRAESELYRSFGCSVIGMTAVPEAFLAKEAGMAYATIALVTDWDCWKEVPCNVDEIMKVMQENYSSAVNILKNLIPSLKEKPTEVIKENEYAIMTDPSLISAQKKEIVDLLLS